MRYRLLLIAAQLLLGLTMAVVGALKFALPGFKIANDAALQSFVDTGWLWQLIGGAELIGGLAVASGRLVPLGLAILAPVVAGIAAFAVKTGGEEAGVGLLVLALHIGLCWTWRASFAPLLHTASHP